MYEKRLADITVGDVFRWIYAVLIIAVAVYLVVGISILSYSNALPFFYTQQYNDTDFYGRKMQAIRSGEIIGGKLLIIEYKRGADCKESVLGRYLDGNYLSASSQSCGSEKIVSISTGKFGFVKAVEDYTLTFALADINGNWGVSGPPPRYDEAVEILRIGRRRFEKTK